MCKHKNHTLYCFAESCIYALGGFDSTNYQASVERFDPRIGSWSPVPSMSTRRSSCGVAALDGHLYCIGGKCCGYFTWQSLIFVVGNDGTMCMSNGERFNVRRNAWEPITSMHNRRYQRPTILAFPTTTLKSFLGQHMKLWQLKVAFTLWVVTMVPQV